MLKTTILITALVSSPIVNAKIQNSKQIDCLAHNIYHEAKGESHKGKLAVAFVTINRTKSNKFPKDVCSVVYQKTNKTFQFSWVKSKKNSKVNNALFEDIKDIAQLVYNDYDELDDPTNGALFFHSTKIKPRWNRKRITTIGGHTFYK